MKISLRTKAGVPKTLVKQKFRLYSLYFPQNKLMSTESRGEFSDLHSIFRLRALRYLNVTYKMYNIEYECFQTQLNLSSLCITNEHG